MNIPSEIVDIIIEYADYQKYHKKKFKEVLKDILDMNEIFVSNDQLLSAKISWQCWGKGWLKEWDENFFGEQIEDEDDS